MKELEDRSGEPDLPAKQRVRRYRLAGVIISLLGLASAGVVYWLETRGQDLADDPSMLGFNRAEERQMGMLYGKQGQLIEDFINWLKQPDTQAFLIAATAAVIAAGCFYFAHILAAEASQAEAEHAPPK